MEAEQERRSRQKAVDLQHRSGNNSVKANYAEWLAEIPVHEFMYGLEWLCHSFQARDLQTAAWKEWEVLTKRFIMRWRHRTAGSLVELLGQLVEEGEPYLGKTSNVYGQYLVWYSRFLEQEARWEEARAKLEEAVRVFKQINNPAAIADSLNSIGTIYDTQGDLEQALDCYQRALVLNQQGSDPTAIAYSLDNIGDIYDIQGDLEQAIEHYARSLHYYESLGQGFESDVVNMLVSLATCYAQLAQHKKSLTYERRAQDIRKTIQTHL